MWEQYQRASAPAPLPTALGGRAGESARTISVRIGDDIPGALRDGKLGEVKLQLKPRGAVPGDALGVRFNDAPAQATVAARDRWLVLPLPPRAVKQGVNQLRLAIARRGQSAGEEIVIAQARVDVHYRQSSW